jgi:hypothetical protein
MRRRLRIPLTILCFNLSAGIAVCQQPAKPGRQENPLPLKVSTAAAAESTPKPSWTVKYLAGSLHLEPDSWLRIAFIPQSALAGKKNLFITVLAEQIVSIEYSARVERDLDRVQGPRSGCGYASSMIPDMSKSRPEDLIATKVTPRSASRLAEGLLRHHSIQIVWIEEGKKQQVSLSINDCEYESLIANLRWLLETRWGEVARDISK